MALVTDHRAIPFRHWQAATSLSRDRMGEVAAALDDLEQTIRTIVLTEKGSVPTEPEKCTRLLPYIDRRPDFAIPNLTREIFDALALWEPRIVVERVAITRVDFAHWRFPVFWRERANVSREIRQTVVILPEERRPGVSLDAA